MPSGVKFVQVANSRAELTAAVPTLIDAVFVDRQRQVRGAVRLSEMGDHDERSIGTYRGRGAQTARVSGS